MWILPDIEARQWETRVMSVEKRGEISVSSYDSNPVVYLRNVYEARGVPAHHFSAKPVIQAEWPRSDSIQVITLQNK
jgi:hypothetical protein